MVIRPAKTSISKGKELVLYAISYIRVSTQRQSELDKSGIRRQIQAYIDWLEKHPEYKNLDGVEFRDLGVSGRKNIKSGALGIFLKMAEKGEIPPHTCLVVESMSRLTRDCPYDGIGFLRKIWDLGHTIAFTQGRWNGDVITGKERGIFGQIESALDAASYEWEEKRERVVGWHKDTAKQMEQGDYSFFKPRKKGKKTNYPFWLDFDKNTNNFFEIKDKADLVRRIFNMAETTGIDKLAKILRKEGIKNPVEWGTAKYLTPKVIDESILRHRAVLGERNHRGVIYKGVYPSIITPEQFDQVQAAIIKRTHEKKGGPNEKMVNLFQGVSFCSHCGGRLHVVRKTRSVCKKKWSPNSPKIDIEYRNIYCDNAAVGLNDCPATNSAPYIHKHNGIDNELKILNKIATFRWADFFTDDRHDEQLKVLKETRMRLLNERNQIDEKLSKLKRSRARAWEEDNKVEPELKELIKTKEEEYETANTSYKRSILDQQNLERKKSGQQLEVDIQKKVKTFIEKDRTNLAKRFEFNMFLREAGIVLEAAIHKKKKGPTVKEEHYQFEVGIGKVEKNVLVELDRSVEDLDRHNQKGASVDLDEVIKARSNRKSKPVPEGHKRTIIAAVKDDVEPIFIEITEDKSSSKREKKDLNL